MKPGLEPGGRAREREGERENTHKLVEVRLLGPQSYRKTEALRDLPGVGPHEVEPDHLRTAIDNSWHETKAMVCVLFLTLPLIRSLDMVTKPHMLTCRAGRGKKKVE